MQKLNIGCGRDLLEDYINIDISKDVRADMILDIKEGIPFPDNSIKEIICNNVLTQIESSKDFIFVMNEMWRVTSGDIFIRVPNAEDICAWQDPMDCRRFTDQTFTYMQLGNRRYEQYGKHYGFKPFNVILLDNNKRQMMFKLTPVK
jgi:hypothetical protein